MYDADDSINYKTATYQAPDAARCLLVPAILDATPRRKSSCKEVLEREKVVQQSLIRNGCLAWLKVRRFLSPLESICWKSCPCQSS
jgi:hypothetical protein